MLNKIYKLFVVLFASILPTISFAEEALTKTKAIANGVGDIVDILVQVAFVAAVAFFFWGIAKYIWSVGNDGKEEGKKIMVWGVVGLFVMTCVWGLVYFIRDELQVGGAGDAPIPTIGGTPTVTPAPSTAPLEGNT